jgi:trans-aconitate 2-methyltransferase
MQKKMTWDTEQYMQFEKERVRPAIDLLQQIDLEAPEIIYDLGCGTGNVTDLICKRYPHARVSGFDNSQSMLEKARQNYPKIQWQEADVENWQPKEKADAIFSNACFQWLDDHETLFPSLLKALKPGGILAIQMPNNFTYPSHQIVREVCSDYPWTEDLLGILRHGNVLSLEKYYQIFSAHSEKIHLWETIYHQVLSGENPVLEWIKGTGLRPILSKLINDEERERFLSIYGEKIKRAYPKESNGKTILPFARIFIIVEKS